MSPSYRRSFGAALVQLALVCAALPLFPGSALEAQQQVRLSAGDSVRVDGEIVGRILFIDGPDMVVVSREAPRCRAGQMHGEAAVCDPAPLVRHEMKLEEVVIERRIRSSNLTLRTIGGGLLGAAAFGAAGWLIGPSVGFGRVEGCLEAGGSTGCAAGEPRYTADELESLQRKSDQKKGALFFGALGGTATAVLVNRLSQGWVRVEPVMSVDPAGGTWGLGLSLPAPR